MKVLLINTSFKTASHYGVLDKLIKPRIPLSLGTLVGFLETKNVKTMIFDEQVENIKNLEKILTQFNPQIVGLSILTPVAHKAYAIAKEIKKINKKIKVIAGNVHPTVLPEEPLSTGFFDIVVRGEGEFTLWEYAKYIESGKSLDELKGISFIKCGKIVHNPSRPFIDNLDEIPPFPYRMFLEKNTNYEAGIILTSRGCPFNCIFCSSRIVSGHRYRTLSPKRVVYDIENIVNNFNVSSFFIADDNFVLDKKRVFEICRIIIEKTLNKKIRWSCNARADLVNKELLISMKDAGCEYVSFGIETASQRLLGVLNKGETVEKNINAVYMVNEVGLKPRGSFMIGIPTETKAETMATIRLARRLPLCEAKFTLATPFPGTKFYELAKEENPSIEGQWDRMSTVAGFSNYNPVYIPKGRSAQELAKLQKFAHVFFYLTIKRIFLVLSGHHSTVMPFSIKSWKDLLNVFRAAVIISFQSFIPKRKNERKNQSFHSNRYT